MADPPSHPGTGNTTTTRDSGRGATQPARRRWVIAGFWIIVAVILLLMIILHVTGAVGPGTGG
jgi:hypothetical protein